MPRVRSRVRDGVRCTTRTAGAAHFDTQIVHLELDIDFFGLGQHGNCRSGRMDSSLRFGGGDALDAMHAGFITHLAEDRIS